ncbi:MAG: hypothetical protein ACYTBR_15490 [Planctomycetota bacterium]
MTWLAPTLWHLLGLVRDEPRRQAPRGRPMQSRYDDLVGEMKRTYGVRVRKWRTSTSGCAWMVRYHDGSVSRLIEAPYPRGPVSCAVFLHEIGHHAIGWDTRRPRCVEEYDAWRWALDEMRSRRLNVTAAVEQRMAESLRYAVSKARRRGLKTIPPELLKYA